MDIIIHTDGGALHNPGPAASAYVISKKCGGLLEKKAFFLGSQTNNYAEYMAVNNALLTVLRLKKELPISSVSFISDSLLLVSQLNGLYKVKNERIREFVFKIRSLEQEIGVPISYTHVLREKNEDADSLVKECLAPHYS
ncbi:MAG: ribonuclease HI family protein [Microgenomates group bacterium]